MSSTEQTDQEKAYQKEFLLGATTSCRDFFQEQVNKVGTSLNNETLNGSVYVLDKVIAGIEDPATLGQFSTPRGIVQGLADTFMQSAMKQLLNMDAPEPKKTGEARLKEFFTPFHVKLDREFKKMDLELNKGMLYAVYGQRLQLLASKMPEA